MFLVFQAAYAADRIPVQGQLFDDQGAPIDGALNVDFTLYADASGSDPVWTESQAVTFDAGAFTAYVGRNTELDLQLFRDHPALWLGIAVDGDSEMAPIELGMVPYAGFATHAGDAATLEGLTADDLMTDIADIEASARAVCFDTEAELTAALADDYAAGVHTHDAADIYTGILSTWRYQAYADLGAEGYLDNNATTDLLTQAQGDGRFVNVGEAHGHDAADVSTGTLSTSRYTAYGDLGAEGFLDNNAAGDLLTQAQCDARYLNVGEAHGHDAADVSTGTLSTSRYSAQADLSAEGFLGNNAATDLLTQADGDGRYFRRNTCGSYQAMQACLTNFVPVAPANCDEVAVGGICESDGECGLSNSLNNCADGSGNLQDDWYIRIQ